MLRSLQFNMMAPPSKLFAAFLSVLMNGFESRPQIFSYQPVERALGHNLRSGEEPVQSN